MSLRAGSGLAWTKDRRSSFFRSAGLWEYLKIAGIKPVLNFLFLNLLFLINWRGFFYWRPFTGPLRSCREADSISEPFQNGASNIERDYPSLDGRGKGRVKTSPPPGLPH
jgi:hypothetical protein